MQMDQRRIARRIGQVITATSLAALCCAAFSAAPAAARPVSGIRGTVVEGPITPVCRPNVPCTRPFANATILVLNAANRSQVATALTNARGVFRVAVAPGSYLVHVAIIDFPRCPEASAKVTWRHVTRVHIQCSTGIL